MLNGSANDLNSTESIKVDPQRNFKTSKLSSSTIALTLREVVLGKGVFSGTGATLRNITYSTVNVIRFGSKFI